MGELTDEDDNGGGHNRVRDGMQGIIEYIWLYRNTNPIINQNWTFLTFTLCLEAL